MMKRMNDSSESLFLIHQNNAKVMAALKNITPEKILLLLPGCVQNPDCTNRITQEIENCEGCGSCLIEEIVEIREHYGIKVQVVSGGTAARAIVKRLNPDLILAVACERELASGISDVDIIPVIGILNETPNGPCNHTTVDIHILKQYLDTFLMLTEDESLAFSKASLQHP